MNFNFQSASVRKLDLRHMKKGSIAADRKPSPGYKASYLLLHIFDDSVW